MAGLHGKEIPMSEIIRRCPDCGQDRAFAQHHGESAWCPDAVDGDCPEWYCLVCGATVLTGEVPVPIRPRAAVARRDRVA
jgi:hypothetical protein